jgi:hypothetical protein
LKWCFGRLHLDHHLRKCSRNSLSQSQKVTLQPPPILVDTRLITVFILSGQSNKPRGEGQWSLGAQDVPISTANHSDTTQNKDVSKKKIISLLRRFYVELVGLSSVHVLECCVNLLK